MTYLLRIVLPDRPGSLGAVATALGTAGADIVSLDVVERGEDYAVDDIVVELPGGLADTLLTAAHSVPGVTVEALRPYQAGGELHRDLELVDAIAGAPSQALELLAEHAPGVFRATWAVLAHLGGDGVHVDHASAAAPTMRGAAASGWVPAGTARSVESREEWVPADWRALGIELAVTPCGVPTTALLLGRVGGPAFRASEVARLAHLAGIAATVSPHLESQPA